MEGQRGNNSEPNANEYSVHDLEYDIEEIQREKHNVPGNQLGMPQHLAEVLYKIAEVRKRAAKLDTSDKEVKSLFDTLDALEKQIESSRKYWIKAISGNGSNSNSNGYNSNTTIPASPKGGRRKTRQRSKKSKDRKSKRRNSRKNRR